MDRYLMMTLLSLLFLSCSHEENSLTRKDGDWDDDIKLSKHEIVFGSDEGSEVINSEGLWWLSGGEIPQSDIWYKGNGDIHTTGELGTYEWMTLEKPTHKSLLIKVDKNTGGERNFQIVVTCGDFFDYILVTQKGVK